MAIKHTAKESGELLHAEEWNAGHLIDDNTILPEKLDAINAPQDGKAPCYNEEEEKFEWKEAAGVSKHTELTDKEVEGVIDHANLSITMNKLIEEIQNLITSHSSRHIDGGADEITSALNPAALGYALKKVAEVNITEDTTAITINDLDLNAAKFYVIILNLINPLESGTMQLFINNDTDIDNYRVQEFIADGESVNARRTTATKIAETWESAIAQAYCVLQRSPDSRSRWISHANEGPVGSLRLANYFGSHIVQVGNVTRLDFVSSVEDGIGAGTRVVIYGASG